MFVLCTIVVSARKIKQIIINVEDECSDSARAENRSGEETDMERFKQKVKSSRWRLPASVPVKALGQIYATLLS